jgi:tetratricopeptide (TPR) repeat protein
MNRFLLLLIFFSPALLLSCNDKNAATAGNSLLLQPPYDAVSDSIRRAPGNAALYARRSELLWKNGYAELAMKDAIKAWELDKNENNGDLLCAIAGMEGLQDSVLNYISDISSRFPGNIFFRNQLAEGYAAKGNYTTALAHSDTILLSDSGNALAWLNRGKYLALLSDTAQAIVALEKSNAASGQLFVTGELANLYALTANEKTIPFCNALLKADSSGKNGEAFYYKGIYYAVKQQPAAALQQFDECIKRDYTFKEAYIEKGAVQYEQKLYDAALQTFQTLQKIFNTYPDAYYWMGMCYEAKGDKAEAIANYQKTIALDKKFTQAVERLKALGGKMPE